MFHFVFIVPLLLSLAGGPPDPPLWGAAPFIRLVFPLGLPLQQLTVRLWYNLLMRGGYFNVARQW